ncbi:MAG: SUMF1/EgtB/PvdO family nonheme iron enzyme [Bacteroidia bacterium]|nr:SUMF1/EgtB/PvdO family nonheme iron enzyme [Bacteroidia bacterium]
MLLLHWAGMAQSQTSCYETSLQNGQSAYSAGKYGEAIEIWQTALDHCPGLTPVQQQTLRTKISAANSRQREDQLWADAKRQRTIAAYERYLARYPRGRYAAEANRRIAELREDHLWAEAQQQGTIAAYERYIERYPAGRYASEASRRIAELREDELWAEAQRQRTIAAYERYLARYPRGRYAAEANRRIAELREDELWAEAQQQGTIAAYEQYIDRYPTGRYASEANRWMDDLKAKQAEEQRKREALVRDTAAWTAAKTANTCAAYEAYLRDYPQGSYREPAELKRQELCSGPGSGPDSYTDAWTGRMIRIRGGSFQMGDASSGQSDEQPVHRVTLSDFYLGETEVTQAQWRAVMGTNPSYFKDCDQCPVESVSWEEVQEFLRKLNAKTGKTYRLPTEAEWEYAAGGGAAGRTKWAGTDSESSLGNYAWYDANSGGKTHPVKQKQPNALGLYDMSGNVWEWCQDWYGSYGASDISNPAGPASGSVRVDRGGSWRQRRGLPAGRRSRRLHARPSQQQSGLPPLQDPLVFGFSPFYLFPRRRRGRAWRAPGRHGRVLHGVRRGDCRVC